MWNEIHTEKDLTNFMERVCFFHDSCVKEMKYLSGAYVNQELGMYPVNASRTLNIILQRQFEDIPMIEMEFGGLKYLKLFPITDGYTCEITDSAMLLKDGYIYWCDSDDVPEADIDSYCGTIICASKLRWRAIEGCMGKDAFYRSIQ